MRILFMGTPAFAVASLQALREAGHQLCGVFTQPDKPRNRGMKMSFSPVKEYAVTAGIPVYQPLKMKDGEAYALVQELQPELIVVAAYGKILPEDILNYPRHGCINVHSSLLPKYRGAAPINWALLNGETETGVSIMYMEKGLDTGDIIAQAATPIVPEEDALQLTERLAALGAETLLSVVAAMEAGEAIPRRKQDESKSSYASMLSREMSPVDWNRPARAVVDQIRGLIPWPCATAELAGVRVKLFRAEPGEKTSAAPGSVTRVLKDGVEVACGDGRGVIVRELQAEGGRRMAAGDYLRGHPIRL
ncbi:MAG: methionyl-tRNA formyltransferase [Oscillospiraceae bacterium]